MWAIKCMFTRQHRSAAFGQFSQLLFVYIYHGPATCDPVVTLDQTHEQRRDQSVTLRKWHIQCTWIQFGNEAIPAEWRSWQASCRRLLLARDKMLRWFWRTLWKLSVHRNAIPITTLWPCLLSIHAVRQPNRSVLVCVGQNRRNSIAHIKQLHTYYH